MMPKAPIRTGESSEDMRLLATKLGQNLFLLSREASHWSTPARVLQLCQETRQGGKMKTSVEFSRSQTPARVSSIAEKGLIMGLWQRQVCTLVQQASYES